MKVQKINKENQSTAQGLTTYLKFDGIIEYENESWVETEGILKGKLSEIVTIRNIPIDSTHR